jgi:long-chain acyl-CoA synthetase
VGAVIVPNFARLEKHARSQAIAFQTREELIAHPAVCAFMQQQVDETCRWLPRFEKIHQIVMVAREFSMASGELSATLKVKRNVVEDRYRDLVEEMYRRPAPQSASLSSSS